MVGKPSHKPDDPQQSKRFVDTAKELDTDETGTAFERAFGVVVKKPADKTAEKPKADK